MVKMPPANGAPRFFHFVYWAFFGSIFILLGFLLFRPIFIAIPYWIGYIEHVALIVVVVCFGLWIGDILKYLYIRTDIRNAIFSTFIVVILGAAAGYIVMAWKKPPELSLKVLVLDESAVKPNSLGKNVPESLDLRPTMNYTVKSPERLRIFIGAVLSNFHIDMKGGNDLELTIYFLSGDGTVGDIYVLNQTDPADWKKMSFVKALTEKVVSDSLRATEQETLFLMHLIIEPAALTKTTKTGFVRIIARDKATGASAEWKTSVTVEQS